MIGVSEQFQKAIVGSSREIKAKVKFNGVTLLDDDKVISVSLNEIANSNEKLTIGELNSAKATVQFVMPDSKIPLKNGSFSIQSGLMVNGKYEYVDKGTFYIDTIESGMGSKVVTVSGYDSIYRMNVEYEPHITYPALLSNVINDICTQCNITHDIKNIPQMTIYSYEENITCKTFMGYCLGLMGMNGRMNEQDKLIAYWFEESGFKVTWDNQFQEGFKLTSDEDIKITSVTCNGLSCGSGYGISFENPYMTQELLDAIYKKVNGLIYSPSTVEWRGNPALQISDIIKVEDNKGVFHNVILSEHTITLTGMRDTVTCKGSTDELAMNTSNSPTQLAIKRLYNTLMSAFKNTTENILGHNGGYYTVDMNSEGFPSGWTIMDTPTLRDDTKLWRFTSGGLGYSTDGGKTFTKIAFDLEGNFNANVITTGILKGEMFELNLITGTVIIGERNKDGEISSPVFSFNEKEGLKINLIDELEKKLLNISTKISAFENNIYKYEAGNNNLFNDCVTTLSKSADEKGNKYLDDMPLGIHYSFMRNKDICISADVFVKNGKVTANSNIGVEFDVTYKDSGKKTYSVYWYLGQYDLQYLLQTSTNDVSKRIWAHFKTLDEEIISVSNLKIAINLDADEAHVSNPKVEFGEKPTGFDFDLDYVHDELTVIEEKYTVIEQNLESVRIATVDNLTKITTLEKDLNDVNTNIDNIENDTSNLHDALNALNSEVSKINGTITGMQTTITDTINKQSEIKTTVDSISSTVSKQQETITTITGNVSANTKSINSINGSINSINSSINSIDGSINSINGSIGDINNTLGTVDVSIKEIKNNYTEISQTVDNLSLKASSQEEKITTITTNINGIENSIQSVETRLNTAEINLQPTNIMMAVNSQLNANDSIHTTKFTLDRNGAHISGGGLDIVNNNGDKVFYADDNGNLRVVNGRFSGLIESTSGNIGGWGISSSGIYKSVTNVIDASQNAKYTYSMDINSGSDSEGIYLISKQLTTADTYISSSNPEGYRLTKETEISHGGFYSAYGVYSKDTGLTSYSHVNISEGMLYFESSQDNFTPYARLDLTPLQGGHFIFDVVDAYFHLNVGKATSFSISSGDTDDIFAFNKDIKIAGQWAVKSDSEAKVIHNGTVVLYPNSGNTSVAWYPSFGASLGSAIAGGNGDVNAFNYPLDVRLKNGTLYVCSTRGNGLPGQIRFNYLVMG